MTDEEIVARIRQGEDSRTQFKREPIGVTKLAAELTAFTNAEAGGLSAGYIRRYGSPFLEDEGDDSSVHQSAEESALFAFAESGFREEGALGGAHVTIDPSEFVGLLNERGVDFFTGVPDSLLKSFCAYVTDHCDRNHVIAANEGGAVALAAGHYLATGRPALVYMQNSGQGNAVNPLCSLADPDVYSIPMVLLIGWRGEPGIRDEPQHVKQGKVTIPLFETLGIPTHVLEGEGWGGQVSLACEQAMREKRPVALIVRKGLFGDCQLHNRRPDIAALPREQAIGGILRALPEEAVVVSTTGMISRELYESRVRRGEGHDRDFLTVGSMGHASMIALGVARARPERLVVCLDGDGASVMQMGNMAIAGQSRCSNLVHVVLNNAAHDSVGGQPTVGDAVDFEALAKTFGYDVLQSPASQYATTVLSADQVADAVSFDLSTLALCRDEDRADPHPKFLEIKVAKGARADLGRPKEPPQANKALFMKTLGLDA